MSFSITDVIAGILGNVVNTTKASISSITSKIVDAANKIASIAGSATSIASALQPLLVPVVAGGHDTEEINKAVFWGLAVVAIATFFGFVIDVLFPPADNKVARPRFWLWGMLLASFALLIPGLTEVLFSFSVAIKILGLHVTVTTTDGVAGPITESTFSVVGLLWNSGGTLGAVLIVLYAMVIPVAKLFLLGLGELWRCDKDPSRVHAARGCIKVVQTLSKWACPDMFAYILLLYLVRSLDLRSSSIEAPAQLDIGFICFSIFCTFSTITSLAIHLPPKPEILGDAAPRDHPPLLISCFGRRGTYWAAAAMLCIFSALLVAGLCAPVMTMSLDDSLLLQPIGPLPTVLEPLLSALNLSSQVDTDVSILACITALMEWLYYGEASCVLALVMLLGFATLFPVLDMVCLLVAAAGMREEQFEKEKHVSPTWDSTVARSASRVLNHLSMLDVTIMGVVVVSYAAGVYKSQGIVIGMKWGVYLLLSAEVVHYVAYYSVQNALRFVDPPPDQPPPEAEPALTGAQGTRAALTGAHGARSGSQAASSG